MPRLCAYLCTGLAMRKRSLQPWTALNWRVASCSALHCFCQLFNMLQHGELARLRHGGGAALISGCQSCRQVSGKKYVLPLAGMQNKKTDRHTVQEGRGRGRWEQSDMQSRQQEQIAAALPKTTTTAATTTATAATTTTQAAAATWPWPRRQLSHNSAHWLVKRFSNIFASA